MGRPPLFFPGKKACGVGSVPIVAATNRDVGSRHPPGTADQLVLEIERGPPAPGSNSHCVTVPQGRTVTSQATARARQPLLHIPAAQHRPRRCCCVAESLEGESLLAFEAAKVLKDAGG